MSAGALCFPAAVSNLLFANLAQVVLLQTMCLWAFWEGACEVELFDSSAGVKAVMSPFTQCGFLWLWSLSQVLLPQWEH